VGRAGRFDFPGVAVTLYDREEDERALAQILEEFSLTDLVKDITSPEEVIKKVEEVLVS
jgi:hypothetical protein